MSGQMFTPGLFCFPLLQQWYVLRGPSLLGRVWRGSIECNTAGVVQVKFAMIFAALMFFPRSKYVDCTQQETLHKAWRMYSLIGNAHRTYISI